MAFIDGKGLVGQAKTFATEREAELDSQLAAANETIKAWKAIAEARATIMAAYRTGTQRGVSKALDAITDAKAALALVPKENENGSDT